MGERRKESVAGVLISRIIGPVIFLILLAFQPPPGVSPDYSNPSISSNVFTS